MTFVQALLFDLDGTLIDSREDIAASINWTLERLSLPAASMEKVTRNIGNGLCALLERTTGSADPDVIGRAMDLFRSHYEGQCVKTTRLMPGALDALRFYAGKKMAIVSNKPERFCRTIVECLQIGEFFQVVVGGDTLDEKKPSPRVVAHAIDRLDAGLRDSVMVGDSHLDILAARAAGALCCGILSEYGDPRALKQSQPDFLLPSIDRLPERYS